jgi:hypothetical protein
LLVPVAITIPNDGAQGGGWKLKRWFCHNGVSLYYYLELSSLQKPL